SSRRVRWEPMKPAPPVTSTLLGGPGTSGTGLGIMVGNLTDPDTRRSPNPPGTHLLDGYPSAMKIAIAGTGYVGLSNAVILAQHHEVWALDLLPEKVELINSRRSPIEDVELEEYLATKPLNLTATLDQSEAFTGADFV